jgi:hypothetical protein
MKRALMTFGNPFGLALYDKTQENVETSSPKTTSERAAPIALSASIDTKRQRYADEFTQWLSQADDLDTVRSIWRNEQPSRADLGIGGTPLERELRVAWTARGNELAKAAGSPHAP